MFGGFFYKVNKDNNINKYKYYLCIGEKNLKNKTFLILIEIYKDKNNLFKDDKEGIMFFLEKKYYLDLNYPIPRPFDHSLNSLTPIAKIENLPATREELDKFLTGLKVFQIKNITENDFIRFKEGLEKLFSELRQVE